MRYQIPQTPKCHGPRVLNGYSLFGYEAVILENELVRAVILPGRGAMVYEFTYKPKDIDALFKHPNGMRPRGSFTPTDYNAPLPDNHPGGWYECFPSGSAPVETATKAKLGFHGEIWGQPFEVEKTSEDESHCAATMSALTLRTPWKLTKTFSLRKNDSTLYLDEVALNLSNIEQQIHWGQHPTIGAPFLNEQCILQAPATGFFDHADDPMVRLRWPMKEAQDLSRVGAPGSATGKMLFLTDFSEGYARLVSPPWKLALEVGFDPVKFPYFWVWENCNQTNAFHGRAYAMALEPFTGLPKAHELGHGLLTVPGNGSETAKFHLRYIPQ